MNVDDRPYPSPTVDSIDLGVETLVYDGDNLHLLEARAASIWKHADGRLSAAQIAAEIAEGVAGRTEDVHRDVMEFLDQLTDQGLVVTSDTGPKAGYRRPGHVGYVLDGDHALLVHLRNGRRQALNGTGSRVWELICQHGNADTVVQKMRAEHPEAPPTLECEVAALLEQLRVAGLLVPVKR